jgi:hypothetical protein
MGRNFIVMVVISAMLLLTGCVKDDTGEIHFTSGAGQLSRENSERITYINERIDLSGNGSLKSAQAPDNYSYTSAVDIYNTVLIRSSSSRVAIPILFIQGKPSFYQRDCPTRVTLR